MLDAQFWDSRYIEGNTGWDLGGVSPPLQAYIDQLKDRNVSVLIPGCGNAHEAEYLLQSGFTHITVVDISEVAIDRLREKFKGNTSIRLIHSDFFALDGQFDLIIEQTFFCALQPSDREAYALKMHSLLVPSGKLTGVLFNRAFDKEGPPFGGTAGEYRKIFRPLFRFHTFAPCYNSIEPRAGSELFICLEKRSL